MMFGFEEHDPGLELIPIAARRALDAVGARLSLAAWRALDLRDREALVESGSTATVPRERVEALVRGAAPERVEPSGDPGAIPADLAEALGDKRRLLEDRWPALGGLERYTLAKVARPGHLDPEARRARLLAAFAEIVEQRRAVSSPRLSHLTAEGEAHMVNVTAKEATSRFAVAEAFVSMLPATVELLVSGKAPKGDVLAVARIAGIQAAKRTPELIPLCHAVALTGVEVELHPSAEPPGVKVIASARAFDRTGVEMEALVAASIASLTLYDMLKAVDRGMSVNGVELVKKSGGRSGDYRKGDRGPG